MKKRKALFSCKFPIAEAIGWELYKLSLSQELTDRAEGLWADEDSLALETEATASIVTKGKDFIVSFSQETP